MKTKRGAQKARSKNGPSKRVGCGALFGGPTGKCPEAEAKAPKHPYPGEIQPWQKTLASMAAEICQLRAKLATKPMTTIGEQIIATIVKNNLLHAECTVDKSHPCLVIWSSAAVEQLDALVADMTRASSPNIPGHQRAEERKL